jgi:thioredoxin 1
MTIEEITQNSQFTNTINKYPNVLIDFYAEWCGPCKNIAGSIQTLSNQSKFSSVKFIKVNIDNLPDIATGLKVKSIPTFMTFKNGKHQNTVTGANLENVVKITEALLPIQNNKNNTNNTNNTK